MKKMILAIGLMCLIGSAVAAQKVTWVVSPNPVPTKQAFQMTLTNNTAKSLQLNGTPWGVYDSNNKLIYPQIGLPFIIYLPPNASTFWTWDGNTGSAYVAPGNYSAWINFWPNGGSGPLTTLKQSFTILPDEVSLSGTPAPGNNVKLSLASPNAPSLNYQAACSFSRTPTTSIGFNRELALGFDPLFISSLVVGPPTFQAFSGTLDAKGNGVAGVLIPNITALKGQVFYVAYVTLKSNAPGGIWSYSYSKRVPIK